MEREYEKQLSAIILEAMKAKGLTVEKLSHATGVSERSLELLLAERFEQLPPAPYVRGYLLKIAEVTGLEGETLWEQYGKYHHEIRRAGRKDMLPVNRFALPTISKNLLAGIAIALIVVAFVVSRFVWGGRAFTFEVNIPDDLVVATSTFVIEGRVRANDQLTLNGTALYPQGDGSFEKEMTLASGFNTFTFVVKRPLEEERTFVEQIFYESPTGAPQIQ